jgi:hypothetical protein
VTVPAGELRDNSHLDLRFEPLPDSLGHAYRLELSMPDAAPGTGITVRAQGVGAAACGLCATPDANLIFKPLYASAPALLDVAVDDLPRDGDWARITTPPSVAANTVIALRLTPGAGPDATRLQYGLTTNRAPFGGWLAQDAAGASLKGALLVSTRYQRDVDLRSLAHAALTRLRGGAHGDAAFLALYALALAALAGGSAWLMLGGRRLARDGR